MDLKECSLWVVILLTQLALSAPAGKVTDSSYEKGELSVDATASDSCDSTLWKILFGSLCGVVVAVVVVVAICCFCSGRCNKRRKSEDQEKIPVLQTEPSQVENEQIKKERDFFKAGNYRVDVGLDPKTAHPRLEVSQDGKCVRDTGSVLKVPNSEERFDSHMFVLAKEGFDKGRNYWEVEVGQKKSWDLGVASESIFRQGRITLAPQNGYWVIGLDGKKDYWARTDPWTRLQVSGKPTKIGIFLDIVDAKLSLYDPNQKSKLFTFTIPPHETFYPFFSMGSVSTKLDDEPLKILKKPEE